MKAERVTYITSIDTQPETGNELSPLLREPEDEWLAALVELKDFINLRFGRVLNVYLPEVTGTGAGMSVADLLAEVPEGTEELDVALLERHQLYPMHRLVRDVEKAWECGIFSVNLVPEPVTAFELVEQCFPALVNRLPVAKETDPYGSARTSVYSTQYHDPDTGYIMDKQDVLAGLSRTNSPSPRSKKLFSRPRLLPAQSGLLFPPSKRAPLQEPCFPVERMPERCYTKAMKISDDSLEFLTELLETPSPSGFEIDAQRIWADELRKYTEYVQCDTYGNTWAVFHADAEEAPTLMIEAHADEIGFMIRHITKDGFLYVERVGGTDTAIARGRRVRFLGSQGEVMGVTGNTAIHLREPGEKEPKIWGNLR